jgi:putative redox protein
LTRKEDSIYVAEVISAWATRHLAVAQSDKVSISRAETSEVTVRETREGDFTQTISVGGKHALRADEPLAYGGTDTGPTPYDLLLSGLGACTTMTIRMYADRKKIPLEVASVTLQHDKIHAEDREGCEEKGGKVDQITRVITLRGDLTDEQRQSLLAVAEKCPVHRTLNSKIIVGSTLKTL